MPIGDFEREVLRTIAANRNPESYLGGATVLHQGPASPRSSRDVDIFHDTTESLARSVEQDVLALQRAGYQVELGKSQGTFQRAQLQRDGRHTKIEWVFDSAFRFFPIEPDPELGWRLNFWDAATNKTLALFGRHEFRDYLDAHYLHAHHLHLGALVWAAAGKDPGLTPELILDWIKRGTHYTPDQIKKVNPTDPLDLVQMKRRWLEVIAESESLVARLPLNDIGCLYLDTAGKPVCPNPDSPEFGKLRRHYGSVKGAWPRVVED
jgi:hypothetical protein